MRIIGRFLVMPLVLLLLAACAAPQVTPIPSPVPTPTPAVPKPAPTPTFEMRKVLSIVSFDVGSSGYGSLISVSDAITKTAGITLRVVPTDSGPGAVRALMGGRVDLLGRGIDTWNAFEGLAQYKEITWGPQRFRLLMAVWGGDAWGVWVRATSNIYSIADLKGKRVQWVPGDDARNGACLAFLRFAGLTWDDVVKVEFPSSTAAMKGPLEGTSDVAQAANTVPAAYELEASPFGFRFLETPAKDKEGWARLNKVSPFMEPVLGTTGAGASKEKPLQGGRYGFPIIIVPVGMNPTFTYEITRIIFEAFPKFKNAHPINDGYAPELQHLAWVIPYDAGAVKYYKELGLWKDEHQKRNDSLLKREEVLARTWEDAIAEATKKGIKEKDFPKLWLEMRRNALEKAGFVPYEVE